LVLLAKLEMLDSPRLFGKQNQEVKMHVGGVDKTLTPHLVEVIAARMEVANEGLLL